MIDILLATYNADKYITQQIDSILAQTYKDFKIIISDDGSKDNTISIIHEYISKLPDKITLLPFTKNLGVKENFNYLLKNSNNEYIAFSDHDDIWLENKLEVSIEKLKILENNSPALVYTDKSLVDENIHLISLSSNKSENLKAENFNLNKLLVQNTASGCTIMINKKLKNIIGSIPEEAVMHDHYIMLIASIFGKIEYIDKPLILYRQHDDNIVGGKKYNLTYIIKKLLNGRKALSDKFQEYINQSKKIEEIYNDKIDSSTLDTIKKFNTLDNASFIQFRYILIKNNFLKTGLMRKLGMLILL